MSAFLSNQLYELERHDIEYNVLDPADFGFYASAVNLYTSREQALNHPERTQRFVEASNRGWRYALDHTDEVIDIIYEQYSQRKSKEALRFEAKVTRDMMLLDLSPIGNIREELCLRTFKQLKQANLLPPEARFRQLALDDLSKQRTGTFALTPADVDYLDSKEKLVMCMDPQWMPFEGLQNGEHIGISADIFELFWEKLPVRMEVFPARTWADSVAAAKSRRCDLYTLVASTPERRQYMDFTEPYIDFPVVLATNTSQIFIEDFEQVTDQPIGMVTGYAINELLRKQYPDANFVEVVSIEDGLQRVERGELYGYVDNLMPIAHMIQHKFTGSIKISARLDERVSLAVGTRNDEPILGDIFQRLVQDLNSQPELKQSIYNRWVSVRQEVGFDYRLLWQIMAVVAVAGFLLLLHMVQLMRYNAQLKRLSTTDSLTQLHNRHRMEEMLSEQRSLQERYDEPCGILLLDVDHFKQVNDRYGHQTGDRVLQEFAQLIRTNIRITDRACRWGGEEFLIICPQTNLEGTRALAEKLLEGIRTHEFPHGESMTGSIGLGMLQDEVALHHQLERIDNALYQAKNQGRNRVVGAS